VLIKEETNTLSSLTLSYSIEESDYEKFKVYLQRILATIKKNMPINIRVNMWIIHKRECIFKFPLL